MVMVVVVVVIYIGSLGQFLSRCYQEERERERQTDRDREIERIRGVGERNRQ